MRHQLVLAVAAAVSLGAIALGAVGLRLPLSRLGTAVGIALEVVGATVVFSVANLVAGMVLVLVLRRLTPIYFSLYDVADIVLLVLSALQALVFEAWRQTRR